jgi:hypothetical protein
MNKKKKVSKKQEARIVRKLRVQLEILESLERTALLRAKAKRIRIAEVKSQINERERN